MKPTEVAWLSGFFDGEGCLMCYMSGRNRQYKTHRITITNTHKPSLDYVSRITNIHGIDKKTMTKIQKRKGYKQQWTWRTNAQKEIVDICKQMLPYLVVKKNVVKKFLDQWKDIK